MSWGDNRIHCGYRNALNYGIYYYLTIYVIHVMFIINYCLSLHNDLAQTTCHLCCRNSSQSQPVCPDKSLTWSVLRRVQVAKDVAGGHGWHLIWGWGWTTIFYNRVSSRASAMRVRSRRWRRLRHLLIYRKRLSCCRCAHMRYKHHQGNWITALN